MEAPQEGELETISEIKKQTLHQIREFFTLLDPNNTGSIAPYNARIILTALGKVTTVNEFRHMVYKLNLMQSDFTVENIMRLIEYHDNTVRKDPDSNIKEAFNVYDADSDGYINSNDIYHIITRIGSGQLTKAEADILMEDFEPDARKRIRTSEISFHNVNYKEIARDNMITETFVVIWNNIDDSGSQRIDWRSIGDFIGCYMMSIESPIQSQHHYDLQYNLGWVRNFSKRKFLRDSA